MVNQPVQNPVSGRHAFAHVASAFLRATAPSELGVSNTIEPLQYGRLDIRYGVFRKRMYGKPSQIVACVQFHIGRLAFPGIGRKEEGDALILIESVHHVEKLQV
jgi:hypothetical protein